MPIFDATEDQRRSLKGYDELPMVPLERLVGKHAALDLLHIDIQGGEFDLIESCLDFIKERVAYMVVGTHSRAIEGRIMTALDGTDWLLEIERPAIVNLTAGRPFTEVDGVQGWRNTRLRPQS